MKTAFFIFGLLAQFPLPSGSSGGGGGGGVVPAFADQTACEQGIVDDEIASPECVAQAIAATCSLNFKKEVEFTSACQNTVGGTALNLPGIPTFPGDANTPSPKCYYGSSTTFGVLIFDSAQVGQYATKQFRLPATMSSVKATITSRTSSTTGSTVWKLDNVCVAPGSGMGTGTTLGGGSGGPSYSNSNTISIAAATANANYDSSETTLTSSGCSAGNQFMFKLGLDATNSATDPELVSLVIKVY